MSQIRKEGPVLKPSTAGRSVTEIGPGDYIKVGTQFLQVASNSAAGASRTPREWTIKTIDGSTHGMWDVRRYAKSEDME
jgi:hypothetical protein